MILRVDRLQIELPAPDLCPIPPPPPTSRSCSAGNFGEMSTLMNYTYQSFNFRGRDEAAAVLRPDRQHRRRGVRPHRARRRTRSTCCSPARPTRGDRPAPTTPLARAQDDAGNPLPLHRQRPAAPCRSTRMGKPWTGEYVFSSGNLKLDLLHNFFLECGARANKIRVYEMTKDPTARADARLPARARRRARAGLRQGAREAHRRGRQEDAADAEPPRRGLQGGAAVRGPRAARAAIPVQSGRLQGHHRGVEGRAPARRHATRGARRPSGRGRRPCGPAGGTRSLRSGLPPGGA